MFRLNIIHADLKPENVLFVHGTRVLSVFRST